jgi:hypothetical protein
MFGAFMPPYIYFYTDVLLWIYSVNRKHQLSFKSELDSRSKPKLCRSISKIFSFQFLNIIGFKIYNKFKILDLKVQKS